MAVDYSIYDFKKSFTIHEAAQIWAETEYEGENVRAAYNAIYSELLRDVKGNYLQHRITRDIRQNWINWDSDTTDHTNWSRAEVWRDDLKQWAEARGQKPKFLFPEMRTAEAAAPIKKADCASIAESKQGNELHALLEKVYLALRQTLRRSPDADQLYSALKERGAEFDTKGIITEMKDKRICWNPTDGTSGKPMGRKALQNLVSELNKKYEKQSVVKKIPA